MKNIKPIFKILIAAVALIVVAVCALVLYANYMVNKSYESYNRDKPSLSELEDEYKKNPDIDQGMYLIDAHYISEDYERALYYAKKCIELGVDDTPIGYLLNFQMAMIYNKLRDVSSASRHLEKAIALDRRNIITDNGWVEKENLGHLVHKRK